MRMYDGPRQITAALVASVVFLALFFGMTLIWWLALGLAVAVYGAMLLVIGRKRPLEEIRLSARTSAADIQAAAAALENAGDRLVRAARTAPDTDRDPITEMADNVLNIRKSILEDPEDYRPARAFVNVHLPNIVQTVETYVKLSQNARGDAAARVAELGREIRGFAPVIDRINAACIENDLRALEVEVAALSQQLDRA